MIGVGTITKYGALPGLELGATYDQKVLVWKRGWIPKIPTAFDGVPVPSCCNNGIIASFFALLTSPKEQFIMSEIVEIV